MNKYGTRLQDKVTWGSKLLAITSPEMLDDYYVISEAKDRGKRAKFVWSPMDDEWKQNVSDRWWYKNDLQSEIDPKMYQLREKLLSFGGEATCLPVIEEDIDDILERGQFWFGSGAKLMRGEACQCHRNASELYFLNHEKFDVRICTGYALSKDGMWRQHSSLVLHNPRSNQIIETTVPRIGYFGFVMTEDQFEQFADDNWI